MITSKVTDMATLYEIARLKVQTFPLYNEEIKRVLQIKRIPDYSERSDTLQGESVAKIIKQSMDALTQHRANKNNPHGETVDSIGIMSKAEMDSRLANKLPSGIIEIGGFGYDFKNWTDANLTGAITRSSSTITVRADTTVLISGSVNTVTTSTINLSALSTSWNTSTWYLYVRVVEGQITLEADTKKFADTLTRMYIGSTGPGTNTVNLVRVIKVGRYRVSSTPVGSGIAVGLGTVNTTTGIDRRWVPAKDITQATLPPMLTFAFDRYDKSANGTAGFIEGSRSGLMLLQTNVNVDPNVYFKLDGEGIVVTAVATAVSGTRTTVTKISNTQFRFRSATYGLSKIDVTAKSTGGDTITYSFFVEHRTNVGIKLGSHSYESGTQGGSVKLTAMANANRQLTLSLSGDGVTTSYAISTVSGGNQTVNKVSQTTYAINGQVNSVRIYTFTANDKYGRSASTLLYVEIRATKPPIVLNLATFTGQLVSYNDAFRIHRVNGPIAASSWSGPAGTRKVWSNVKGVTVDAGDAGLGKSNLHAVGTVVAFCLNDNHVVRFSSSKHISGYAPGAGKYPNIPASIFVDKSKTYYSPGVNRNFSGAPGGKATVFPLGITPGGYSFSSTTSNAQFTRKGVVEWTFAISNEINETVTISIRTTMITQIGIGSNSHSCFTPESLVLMADGTLREIVDIVPGDMIMTATGPSEVWKVDTPTLGDRHKLVSFNGKCKTSTEHSFWSKEVNSDKQFWATRDMDQWELEASIDSGPNFDGLKPHDLTGFTGSYDVATVDGWETVNTVIEEELSHPELQLYNLRIKNGGSYFVDGFLVSSMCTIDCDVDWEQFKWDGNIQSDYPVREIPWSQSVKSKNSFRHQMEKRNIRRNRK